MLETTFYLAAAVLALTCLTRNTASSTTVALSLALIALVTVLVTSQRPTEDLIAVIHALSELMWGPRDR